MTRNWFLFWITFFGWIQHYPCNNYWYKSYSFLGCSKLQLAAYTSFIELRSIAIPQTPDKKKDPYTMGIVLYVDIKYSLRSALLYTHPIHWSISKKYLFNLKSIFILFMIVIRCCYFVTYFHLTRNLGISSHHHWAMDKCASST